MPYYDWLRPFLFMLTPETAHDLSHWALKNQLVPIPPQTDYPVLQCELFNKRLPHPVGLAAGYDKNADLIVPLLQQGFSFVEVGTITPEPQPGNPKPRLFRLPEDQAIINRFGFNSRGGAYAFVRLEKARLLPHGGLIGVNIGKNKSSQDARSDYLALLQQLYVLADYITINISSPNTPGLRDLQSEDQLRDLLQAIMQEAEHLKTRTSRHVPIVVKIAPDMDEAQLEAVVSIAMEQQVQGLIISNTTVSRPEHLKSRYKEETGGLSGAPLTQLSTQTIHHAYRMSRGQLPIIGVGGIQNGRDAYDKIRAGASVVQLYSALVYQGFAVIERIKRELATLLTADGYTQLSQAIGAAHPRSAAEEFLYGEGHLSPTTPPA